MDSGSVSDCQLWPLFSIKAHYCVQHLIYAYGDYIQHPSIHP